MLFFHLVHSSATATLLQHTHTVLMAISK